MDGGPSWARRRSRSWRQSYGTIRRRWTLPRRSPRWSGVASENCPRSGFNAKVALEEAVASTAKSPPASSIAVLPFINLSADKDNEYFSDGLAEEIINTLAQIPSLRVIARTSAFAFRGREQNVGQIATALNVQTVLEGSVRRSGSRIRVSAQLIDVSDSSHIWFDEYDRELTDVFAVQDEIAGAITSVLRVKLSAPKAAPRKHRPEPPAYEAYLKGLHQLFRNTPASLERCTEHLERASALDPRYAAPHVALGQSRILLGLHGLEPVRAVMPRVRASAERTLELDPSAPLGHAMLGLVAGAFDYDWKKAEECFRSAMAHDRIPGLVRWPYANFCLAPAGKFIEAAEQMDLWLEEDPLNVAVRAELAFFLNHAGQSERAASAVRMALDASEDYWFSHYTLAEICATEGNFEEALPAAESAYRLAPWNTRVIGFLAGTMAQNGNRSGAEGLLQKLKGHSVGMLVYHLLCSGAEEAAAWYRQTVEQREIFPVLYARAPITGLARQSSAWPEIAALMKLSELST